MATRKSDDREGDGPAGDDDQTHKLASRQDTSRRLPRSDNMNETTVTSLDGHPATGSRPASGTRPSDQMTLPVLAAPTSSDNMPPVNDNDRSYVKSDSSPPSSSAVPVRLPALDVRRSSKEDFQTDKPSTGHELGSTESIGVEGAAQSGKLADVNGDREDLLEAESKDDTKRVDNTETLMNDAQRDEKIATSDAAKTHDDETPVNHTRGDDLAVPENVRTSVDSSAEGHTDAQSQNEVETQPEDAKVDQSQVPGENDSGVNMEEVHNDEPTTTEEDHIVQEPTTTTDLSITSSGSTQLSARKLHDDDRLSVRKSSYLTDNGKRRNSSLEARDSRQLRSDHDQNKPRLLALAQRGEWSVLDQVLRAMEKSSYYEVNLADEVCDSDFRPYTCIWTEALTPVFRPRHQGVAHGGNAPAKIVRAPAKITGVFMFKKSKKTKWQPCVGGWSRRLSHTHSYPGCYAPDRL